MRSAVAVVVVVVSAGCTEMLGEPASRESAVQPGVPVPDGGAGEFVPPRIAVELTWSDADADVDLHVVFETNTNNGSQDCPDGVNDDDASFYLAPCDCHYQNPSPDWAQTPDQDGDEPLLVDALSGPGPEMFYFAPPLPGRYTVYASYWDGAVPVTATATIATGVVDAVSPLVLTTSMWADGASAWPPPAASWGRVATIAWPSAEIQLP